MGLKTFFRDFYCLPIRDIMVLMAVATWGFLRLKEHFESKCWWKAVLLPVFLGCTAVILYLTVSTRDGSSNSGVYLIPFHSYREVFNGGNPEIYRSNFMNVVLFYPSGLLAAALLPKKWPGWIRVLLPFLLLAGLSVGVEYLQYINKMGMAEIDDVIHNSLGALLGSLCSLIPLPRKRS